MNAETLQVRTFIYDLDSSMHKKTLLLTHGNAMASVFYSRILPGLAAHYRVVMFDNMSWGLNTRLQNVGDALESPEKAERWVIEWW